MRFNCGVSERPQLCTGYSIIKQSRMGGEWTTPRLAALVSFVRRGPLHFLVVVKCKGGILGVGRAGAVHAGLHCVCWMGIQVRINIFKEKKEKRRRRRERKGEEKGREGKRERRTPKKPHHPRHGLHEGTKSTSHGVPRRRRQVLLAPFQPVVKVVQSHSFIHARLL